MPSMNAPAGRLDGLLRYLRAPSDGRAWLALLYVMVRMPLAFAYLVLWAVGFGVSVSLVVVIVGIALLALFLLAIWVIGKFERELAHWWLGTEFLPQRPPVAPDRTFWRRQRDFFGNAVLWKTAGWTVLQIPIGFVAFFIFFVLLTVALALVTGPAIYLGQLAAGSTPLSPTDVTTNGGDVLPAPLLIVAILAGGLLLPGILHLARAAAALEAELAKALLAVSPTRLQLAESRARAEVERQRAETSEQSRRQLIVNVSHELRTPIASIRGHVESLLQADREQTPEDAKRYLEVVQRETLRLGALADDLLAAAQGDAGELRLDVKPVAAGDCVRQVVETMAPLAARERSVTVVQEVPAGLPLALADHDRLVQVLANLVRNAIKYTPEGGIVALGAAPGGGAVEITVRDTGIGIPPADLERIFERFYRTDASRARSTGGFGLGLAISRDLVVAMGGTITAQSAEGQGSTFTIRLREAS